SLHTRPCAGEWPGLAGLPACIRGCEGQPDRGVDEARGREAALEVEERRGVGKAEEGPGVGERDGSGPRRRDRESAGALAREEQEPAVARKEQQPRAAVGADGGEPTERHAGELEPARDERTRGPVGRRLAAGHVALASGERRQRLATRLHEPRAPG